jgi:hypothetical protein
MCWPPHHCSKSRIRQHFDTQHVTVTQLIGRCCTDRNSLRSSSSLVIDKSMAGVVEARIRLLTATHQARCVARNAAYKANRSQKRQMKHNTYYYNVRLRGYDGWQHMQSNRGHIFPHAWPGLLYSFARPLGIIAHAVMTIHAGIKAIPALSLGCYIRVANVTPSVHLTVLVAWSNSGRNLANRATLRISVSSLRLCTQHTAHGITGLCGL